MPQDIGEPGIANVEVTLKDQSGHAGGDHVTDVNGRYLFTGVEGRHRLLRRSDDGGLPGGVSQASPAGTTTGRTVQPGRRPGLHRGRPGLPAGRRHRALRRPRLGGRQRRRLRDSARSAAGRHRPGSTGTPTATGSWTRRHLVGTTTSAPDGSYLFTGAAARDQNYFVTSPTQPGRVHGHHRHTYATRTSSAATAYLTADFGFQGSDHHLLDQDRVWLDADADGTSTPERDRDRRGHRGPPRRQPERDRHDTTAADGMFTFSGLAGGSADYTVRLSDTAGLLSNYYGTTTYAWRSSAPRATWPRTSTAAAAPQLRLPGLARASATRSSTTSTERRGPGAGEPGIAGVVVSLYRDSDGDGVIDDPATARGGGDSVTTDANGQYLFPGSPNGNYIVSVPIPAGYDFTGPGTDSDRGPAGIQKGGTMAGANVLDRRFRLPGHGPAHHLGRVWNDADADGVIDGGESGIAGVTLDILARGPRSWPR